MATILALERIFEAVRSCGGGRRNRSRDRREARRSASLGRTAPARPRCSPSSGTARPSAAACSSPVATSPRLPPAGAVTWASGALIPGPAAVGGMTTFENLLVGGGFRRGLSERDDYAPCASCSTLRARRQGQPACRRADAARPQAARARARARHRSPGFLLLDEIAGGLTEHECKALVGRSDVRAKASRSSGSSMSCMRCSRWWTA